MPQKWLHNHKVRPFTRVVKQGSRGILYLREALAHQMGTYLSAHHHYMLERLYLYLLRKHRILLCHNILENIKEI